METPKNNLQEKPNKKIEEGLPYPYIITGSQSARGELQEVIYDEPRSWKVKEVGEITSEIAELENDLIRREYEEWASDPESLKNTKWVYGTNAKILSYEKWISSKRMTELKFEPGNDEVLSAKEDQLPKNYLRMKYKTYYEETEKLKEIPISYFEWLKARKVKLLLRKA